MAEDSPLPLLPRCTNPLEFEYVERWAMTVAGLRAQQEQAGTFNRVEFTKFMTKQVTDERNDRLKRFSGYFIVPVMYNSAYEPDSIKMTLGWAITWPNVAGDNTQQLVSSIGMTLLDEVVSPPGVDIFASGLVAAGLCRALGASNTIRRMMHPEHRKFEDENQIGFEQ